MLRKKQQQKIPAEMVICNIPWIFFVCINCRFIVWFMEIIWIIELKMKSWLIGAQVRKKQYIQTKQKRSIKLTATPSTEIAQPSMELQIFQAKSVWKILAALAWCDMSGRFGATIIRKNDCLRTLLPKPGS